MARPVYPDVGNISDRYAQQSVKALWDRIFAQAQSIAELQAQITSLQSTVSSLQAQLSSTNRKLNIVASPAGE